MNITSHADSQQRTILDYLLNGHPLTVSDALKIARTHDLRKHVADLRKKGWKINDVWCTSTDGKRFKRYFIKQENRIPANPSTN